MTLNQLNEGLEKILKEDNLTKLDEVLFNNKYELAKHFIKHVPLTPEDTNGSKFDHMTVEKYDEAADKLSESPAGPARSEEHDVVGFITRNGRYIKYKKSTQEFVVYTPRRGIISYYPLSYEDYLRNVDAQFMYEFRENR